MEGALASVTRGHARPPPRKRAHTHALTHAKVGPYATAGNVLVGGKRLLAFDIAGLRLGHRLVCFAPCSATTPLQAKPEPGTAQLPSRTTQTHTSSFQWPGSAANLCWPRECVGHAEVKFWAWIPSEGQTAPFQHTHTTFTCTCTCTHTHTQNL